MLLLLVACGILYLPLGDENEALMLLGFVFVVIGITFYQERNTERALEALRDLSSPRALVIRDGGQCAFPAANSSATTSSCSPRATAFRPTVALSCVNLSADESLLTGESAPVGKRRETARWQYALPAVTTCLSFIPVRWCARERHRGGKGNRYIGDRQNRQGAICGQVEETPLQKETGRIVRILAVGRSVSGAVVIVVYGLTRGNWLSGLLAGLTLAMAMLPEELPVVLIMFLALGAWRISKERC